MTLEKCVRAGEALFQFRSARSYVLVLLLLLTVFGISHTFFLSIRYFERDSEQAILHSYRFLLEHPEHPETAAMRRMGGRKGHTNDIYFSQVGLPYQALRLLHAIRPISEPAADLLLRIVATTATSIVLLLLFVFVSRHFSAMTCLCLCILICGSPTLHRFASNYYWLLSFLLAPFVLPLVLWERHRSLAVLSAFCACFIKFLCGYEYASNIMLLPVIAVLWHQLASGEKASGIIRQQIPVAVAAFAGFVAALAIHLGLAVKLTGSLDAAIKEVSRVITYRTSGDYFERPVSLVWDAAVFINHIFQQEILLLSVIVIICWAATRIKRRHSGECLLKMTNWDGTLLAGALASLSWLLIARGHMRDHLHVSFIVFFVPFLLIGLIVVAHTFAGVLKESMGRKDT